MHPEPPSNPKRTRLLAMSGAAAIVVLGLGAFALLPKGLDAVSSGSGEKEASPRFIQTAENRGAPPHMLEAGAPFSFADLVERVSPAVVTVTAETQETDAQAMLNSPDNLPEPFRDFFNQFGQGRAFQIPHKAVSMGSGFIIDHAGYIVTNNHVIENAKKITVKLPDGRSFDAKLIGSDTSTDVALLKVKSDKSLPTVEFGDDRQLRVGDWVIAVGNPFGLSNTVTAGIVSSLSRDLPGGGPYNDFIQIDAPINRGNSGGPTFDLRGQVVGMNSMIFSPSGGSVGIGFAIPSTTIRDVVGQLESHGRVARGWLGVSIQSITPDIAASLGIKEAKGAIVASVVPDGPAAKAGFQQGDVVLAINGKPVEDNRDLTRRVAALPAGSRATFTLTRQGSIKTVSVQIAQRKDEQLASVQPAREATTSSSTGEAMGLGLAAVTPEMRRNYNLQGPTEGVLITRVDPNSDAADKGLEPGDILVSIGNRAVHTPQEVLSRIADAHAQGRKSVLLLVSGSAGPRYVAVEIGQT
ncbi:MAG: DegQ family serine endoprotease [Alphaproteobacteria bacterium]|nr:DegQ family serine endoprotease [Alphaproteobacteria bacterium]